MEVLELKDRRAGCVLCGDRTCIRTYQPLSQSSDGLGAIYELCESTFFLLFLHANFLWSDLIAADRMFPSTYGASKNFECYRRVHSS
jgi:hypothetical protein